MSEERLEEFREFIDFMYESIDIEDHQRFIAISESMIKDGWFNWIYRYAKEQTEQVWSKPSLAWYEENSKKLTELNYFLQDKNMTRIGEHVIDIAMDLINEQAKRVQELEDDCDYISHQYGLEAEQNKRYREALEEILENEISCWEIIKNKLTHAVYK